MKIEPIFLNADWDEDAQKTFWDTLKKKRSQKMSYVTRKAGCLFRATLAQEAIVLLDYFVQDYLKNEAAILAKSKYPRVDKIEMAEVCTQIGTYYADSGQLEKAETYYLLGAKIYESYPNDPNLQARRGFDGYLELADIFIQHKAAEKAEEYIAHYEKNLSKNENLYPLAKLRAKLACLTGDWKKADKLWIKFYKEISEHQSHLELEKKPYINVMEKEENDVVSAAEAIIVYHHGVCPEVFKKDRKALEKLDGLLSGNIRSNDGETYDVAIYSREFVSKHLLPELGAYLGEVWVNSLGGKWVLGDMLLKARVEIKGKSYNPFEYAYKALYWKYRLHQECYNLK